MRHKFKLLGALSSVALLVGSAGFAAEMQPTKPTARGADINTALSGNTMEGNMEGGDYSGFFGRDGSYRNARSKTGRWEIRGDEICFQGGSCYGLAIDGSTVRWFLAGQDVGGGTLSPGNPHNF